MRQRDRQVPRHESVEHEQPTNAGLMDDDEAPGTGIMGDETVVRTAPGAGQPGIAPGTVNDTDTTPQSGAKPDPN